jgi:hypothetical protein
MSNKPKAVACPPNRVYRGVHITRATRPGVMPWGAYVGGTFVYADTWAGIKELIRQAS